PLFHLVTDDWVVEALFFYILLAIVIGGFSVYFAKLSTWAKALFSRIKNPYQKVVLSGISLGMLIFLFPALYGEGYLAIQQILNGHNHSLLANSIFADYQHVGMVVVAYALVTVFAKSIASLITLNSGGN